MWSLAGRLTVGQSLLARVPGVNWYTSRHSADSRAQGAAVIVAFVGIARHLKVAHRFGGSGRDLPYRSPDLTETVLDSRRAFRYVLAYAAGLDRTRLFPCHSSHRAFFSSRVALKIPFRAVASRSSPIIDAPDRLSISRAPASRTPHLGRPRATTPRAASHELKSHVDSAPTRQYTCIQDAGGERGRTESCSGIEATPRAGGARLTSPARR